MDIPRNVGKTMSFLSIPRVQECIQIGFFIELDYGKNYRKALYLMVKTMVSCRFSLNPIQ